ncbi:helix-turn-helix domain-containing protein [Roseomonas sp. HF4]|uniref:helix-turn-helix domain-containing protein n=1 Tax=Roseomonas sp. HF4 TaxID=2562313 RepID=UPI0010C06195|nr:helix-turn-helix domain-containing protein [Roseomonas sp. HF4]
MTAISGAPPARSPDLRATPATLPAQDAPRAVRPVVFSTKGLPASQQFEAWREQCAPVLDMEPMPGQQDGYAAMHRVWKLGAMALSHVHAAPARFHRSARHIRRDSIDHWIISYVRTGSQTIRAGTSVTATSPRSPHILAMHEPLEGQRETVEWLALFVSRDLFPELAPMIDAATGRPIDGALGGLFGSYLDRLVDVMPLMTEAELPRAAEATRAMIAACVAPSGATQEAARTHMESTRLARLRGIIRQNLRSPTLAPRRLCSLGGVSRSQLYRLFEPLGGVARYIQAERLRHIHRALCEPSDRRDIVRIAEDHGFYDASTFSRAFRREFGATPTEVRRAAQAGERNAPIRQAAAAHGFTEILRTL